MPRKLTPFKALGVETEVPWWIAAAVVIIAAVGAGWTICQQVYAHPERQIVTLLDANKQLAAEVEEYSLHAMEEPEKHELFEEQDGKLILRVFKDHCVLIQRQTKRSGVRTKLVIDLDRSSPLKAERQVDPPASSWNILPVLEAQSACQRGCLNPHPGAFRWWYGERRGEWVEVWRAWPEGCQHVQMFHPRTGSWDSNPDGTARVRWTCCVH
jgi:hypothetical protein